MDANHYQVFGIGEKSWRIDEDWTRFFLFEGSERALLVDTGFGQGDIRALVEGLTERPVMVVNTHADWDHCGGNAAFACAYMHPSDFEHYHQSDAGRGRQALPLWEGDVIDLGGRCFEVILIPGHTPGSIALLDAQERILLSGDSVQAGSIHLFGRWRDMDAYQASLEKLIGLQARFDTIYPSHGPATVGKELLPRLLEGARRAQAGQIKGVPSPDRPADIYDIGEAEFLYR
ncbi:MBL fold metallo-hydrolase [Christensenellaceae bacterium NSJ-44]|uniref:MBL fold metallo-hydrolase n=1 Tax=Luoshenia tenuis TaxID=2763654 RepID=A0A926HJ52_9FIRM|nr:MBL fold metallo-hydrolase [Luoshenia tenuis]MBC8529532.1 MBL fold metallo-hydrolase [Luoshenia tenuis]